MMNKSLELKELTEIKEELLALWSEATFHHQRILHTEVELHLKLICLTMQKQEVWIKTEIETSIIVEEELPRNLVLRTNKDT